ncbi:MAG: hypothetical protein WKG07_45725 [Hymenobacter sp.]
MRIFRSLDMGQDLTAANIAAEQPPAHCLQGCPEWHRQTWKFPAARLPPTSSAPRTQLTQRVTPIGNFYRNDIDAASGYFYSVGPRLTAMNTLADPLAFLQPRRHHLDQH